MVPLNSDAKLLEVMQKEPKRGLTDAKESLLKKRSQQNVTNISDHESLEQDSDDAASKRQKLSSSNGLTVTHIHFSSIQVVDNTKKVEKEDQAPDKVPIKTLDLLDIQVNSSDDELSDDSSVSNSSDDDTSDLDAQETKDGGQILKETQESDHQELEAGDDSQELSCPLACEAAPFKSICQLRHHLENACPHVPFKCARCDEDGILARLGTSGLDHLRSNNCALTYLTKI